MAATSWNPKCPRHHGAAGDIPPIYKFAEGSTQTYKAGALVYLNASSSGQVTIVGDSGTEISGIAQEDASGTQATAAHVQIIRSTDPMIFTCYDASDAAETAASNFVPGSTYDIEEISGVAYAEVDSANATTEELVFVQPVYDVNGDATNEGIFFVEGKSLPAFTGEVD